VDSPVFLHHGWRMLHSSPPVQDFGVYILLRQFFARIVPALSEVQLVFFSLSLRCLLSRNSRRRSTAFLHRRTQRVRKSEGLFRLPEPSRGDCRNI